MAINFKILLLLLISIGLDEAYNSVIIETAANQTQIMKALLSIALFGAEIIFSPIQAGFSDFSSRKIGLIIAFLVTLIALIFLLFPSKSLYFAYFLLIAGLLKGIGGNIIPIARAALADSIKHNFRFAIGLSTSAIAGGYIFIKLLSEDLDSIYVPIVLIASVPVMLFFITKIYHDKYDEDTANKPTSFTRAMWQDMKSIYFDFLKDKIFFLSSSAYYFWEVSFYLVFVKDVELRNQDFKNFSLTMCVGYLTGVLILRFISRWHDKHVLKLGYRISILSIIFIFIAAFSGVKFLSRYSPISGYFVYSLGFGFFVPCLFSMVSKIRKPHEQGKIYGLIDSTDTVAFITAMLIGVFLTSFKLVIFISFIFLFIGTLIYKLSQKHWAQYEERFKT